MPRFPPQRIVCLTEETVETLYLLGEQDRIVGVTGYAVPQALIEVMLRLVEQRGTGSIEQRTVPFEIVTPESLWT